MDTSGTGAPSLPLAYGGPVCTGRLRAEPADFVVEELPLGDPDGDGAHVHLLVEKRGLTTRELVRRVAAFAAVRPAAIGYAGLKDKQAVTRQALTVQIPPQRVSDWSGLASPQVRVLAVDRTRNKLRPGDLAGNRFRILVRGAGRAAPIVVERLSWIAAGGLPNFFGEQRFGRDGCNLPRARRYLAGRPRAGRHASGFLISAARGYLFNRVLARRVEDATWARLLAGDIVAVDGTGRWFGPSAPDPERDARAAALELHPTGPLCGRPDPTCEPAAAAATLESAALAAEAELVQGLARTGAASSRRALRVRVEDPVCERDGDDLRLEFKLPAGSYATVLLRELIRAPASASAAAPEFA